MFDRWEKQKSQFFIFGGIAYGFVVALSIFLLMALDQKVEKIGKSIGQTDIGKVKNN